MTRDAQHETEAMSARPLRTRPARRLSGTVLIVGPIPPPVMGPAISTQMVCSALEDAGASVIHVNTQDRRTVFNTGLLDLHNARLALAHAAKLAWRTATQPVGLVYVPISQNRWGFARDALLLVIARLLRCPAAVHLRGAKLQDFYHSRGPIERWILRRTLGWSAIAIALTPSLRSVYDELVPRERIRVLENAIEDPWPRGAEGLIEERARRAERDPGAMRLLYVANDFATKGAETVVRALSDPGLQRASLRMVGAPPREVAEGIRRLAAELGVGDRVELLGGLEGRAKLEQYEWADAFAYPTENDGQPLVVIEAMAAGLPIVASTFGGIPETVRDTASLVPPGESQAVAQALRKLLERPAQRRELGEAARKRFLAHYTPEPYRRRVVELFGEALAERGG